MKLLFVLGGDVHQTTKNTYVSFQHQRICNAYAPVVDTTVPFLPSPAGVVELAPWILIKPTNGPVGIVMVDGGCGKLLLLATTSDSVDGDHVL